MMPSSANELAAALVVALLLTLSAAAVLYTNNEQAQKDNAAAATRLTMNSILDKGQLAVENEIWKIRNLTVDLALMLRSTGMNSSGARAAMNLTMAQNEFIIDILTYDTRGVVLAAEPEEYRSIEGVDLSGGPKTMEMLLCKVPVMSDNFVAREGVWGSGYGVPVFDVNGSFIGGVSTLYSASRLMNATLPQISAGTGFTWWCMQLNGTLVYDTDTAQVGLNQMDGPEYCDYPELVSISWRMVNESSGYGVYHFLKTLNSGQTITKECFWTTVGAEGVQWRLVLVHWV
jgi:hypothetical protein